MEFEIGAFTNTLVDLFLESPLFPNLKGEYMSNWGIMQTDEQKHPNRHPTHLKDAAQNCINSTKLYSEGMITFDIGNEDMEKQHPYYHILEDSPVIRKRYRATQKTAGSQAKIQDVGKRDYGRVEWNGKTFTKEYSRNVRGSRNRIESVSHWITSSNGEKKFVNRESNSYANIHYHYIERILDSGILNALAEQYGATLKRKIDTGLGEEYFSQFDEAPNNILDIISSFEE